MSMELSFFKYQGTGNDFVMIDNRKGAFPKKSQKLITSLCDRRFGIGADGLILLEEDETYDFKMVYFNSDGKEGSMCGNGGRCLVAFAKELKLIDTSTTFMAVDGLHSASIENGIISLKMQDVEEIYEKVKYTFLNTGSPHHVQFVDDLENFDVAKKGAKIRYGIYGESGSNINFVKQLSEASFAVRTYERGVEDETLSCGTGVTAVALAVHHLGVSGLTHINISTLGGELSVKFDSTSKGYKNIYLIGPAKLVYKGMITC